MSKEDYNIFYEYFIRMTDTIVTMKKKTKSLNELMRSPPTSLFKESAVSPVIDEKPKIKKEIKPEKLISEIPIVPLPMAAPIVAPMVEPIKTLGRVMPIKEPEYLRIDYSKIGSDAKNYVWEIMDEFLFEIVFNDEKVLSSGEELPSDLTSYVEDVYKNKIEFIYKDIRLDVVKLEMENIEKNIFRLKYMIQFNGTVDESRIAVIKSMIFKTFFDESVKIKPYVKFQFRAVYTSPTQLPKFVKIAGSKPGKMKKS